MLGTAGHLSEMWKNRDGKYGCCHLCVNAVIKAFDLSSAKALAFTSPFLFPIIQVQKIGKWSLTLHWQCFRTARILSSFPL